MKNSLPIAVITACFLSSAPMASAQDNSAPARPAMSMEMDAQMSQMQAKMQDMQALMDKIHSTTDPNERRRLMQEHMRTMQEGMATMRRMSKPMTMNGGQRGGMTTGDGKAARGGTGMMDGDMMRHHQMMEERISMMEMMMEQMLKHQQMTESVPAR